MRLILIALFILASGSASAAWYKVQMHAHDFKDDGNTLEIVKVERYRAHGFTALLETHHHIGQNDRTEHCYRWTHDGGTIDAAVAEAKAQLPDVLNIVDTGPDGGWNACDPAFDGVKRFFEGERDGGVFYYIAGQEITGSGTRDVHVIVAGTASLLPVKDASTNAAAWDANVRMAKDAALAPEAGILEPIVGAPHPNYQDSGTWTDLYGLDIDWIEIWSGHKYAAPNGFGVWQPSAVRTWDLINFHRVIDLGWNPIWGAATDDAHDYYGIGPRPPGRGWIEVEAGATVDENVLLESIAAGAFRSVAAGGTDWVGPTIATWTVSESSIVIEATGQIRVLGLLRADGWWREIGGSPARNSITVSSPCAYGDFWGVRVEVKDKDGARAWSQPVVCP